jgi:hypothetical protein
MASIKRALTEEEKRELTKNRTTYFKGTIAVSVIYGVFVLILALIGIMSPAGKEYIFRQNFYFTITFIGGTLLVITLMLIQLFNYNVEPPKIEVNSTSCPDYWELKKTTAEELENIKDNEIRYHSKYYCVPSNNSGIYKDAELDLEDDTKYNSANMDDVKFKEVITKFNDSNTGNSAKPIQCNRVYPGYMAKKDLEVYPDDPNTIRCRFVKDCNDAGVPIKWNAVCP